MRAFSCMLARLLVDVCACVRLWPCWRVWPSLHDVSVCACVCAPVFVCVFVSHFIDSSDMKIQIMYESIGVSHIKHARTHACTHCARVHAL